MKYIIIIFGVCCISSAQEAKKIDAHELGWKYILIGETGVQLGKQVEVTGKLIKRHPYLEIEVEVSRIDEFELKKPVYLRVSSDKVPADSIGKFIRIIGMETGELKPIELINQIDRSSVGNMGCELKFEISKVVEISEKKIIIPKKAEQGGADQPATAPELKSEGKDKHQPESKVSPR